MKEIKLKLSEILQVEIELNGLKDQEGVSRINGLLTQMLPLVTKYWLNDLAETVGKEKKKIEESRNDLIKKYGTTDDAGNTTIELFVDEAKTERNPKYSAFEKEYVGLLLEEKSISYTPIKLSLLKDVTATENYSIFFRFVEP